MRKLSAWIHSHPIIAMTSAFVALFLVSHFFLNWRAERRWQAYAEAARARGVKLLLTDFERPEIPDAENFAALPMMREAFGGRTKNPMSLSFSNVELPGTGNPLKGERLDWEQWQNFFKNTGFISETSDSPPGDVLHALEHYAPQFHEWNEWKTHPRCRFPIDLKAGADMRPPHLGFFSNAARLFPLRMRAHLALGDSGAAYADFCDGFQVYRALEGEPVVSSNFVRLYALANLLAGIGDGLTDHAWKETELRRLETDSAKIHIWEDYRFCISVLRGFANWSHESLLAASGRKRAQLVNGMFGGSSPVGTVLIACIPRRVYRDNQLRSNQYLDEMAEQVNSVGTRLDPDRTMSSGHENLSLFDRYYFSFVADYSGIAEEFARKQTRLDQARLAIAIERFRIARGAIPESLAELVPDFIAELPRDIYTGQPMIYRRKETGGFLLYSVGPDRRDDGGAVNTRDSERNQPDWVWLHSRD